MSDKRKILKKPRPPPRPATNIIEVIDAEKLENLKREIFPSTVLNSFENVELLPTTLELATLQEKNNIHPYIIYMDEQYKVSYCEINYEKPIRKHFMDTLKYLYTKNSYKSRNWSKATKLLLKPIVIKKIVNHRMCYKFKNIFFLTKKHFTFGNRLVDVGTIHIIKTGNYPMSIYTLKEKIHTVTIKKFPFTKQNLYRKQIVNFNSVCSIPSHTVYILYTTDRSLFSLHIAKEEIKLPFANIIPIKSNVTYSITDIYKYPVQTPSIGTLKPIATYDLTDSSSGEDSFFCRSLSIGSTRGSTLHVQGNPPRASQRHPHCLLS